MFDKYMSHKGGHYKDFARLIARIMEQTEGKKGKFYFEVGVVYNDYFMRLAGMEAKIIKAELRDDMLILRDGNVFRNCLEIPYKRIFKVDFVARDKDKYTVVITMQDGIMYQLFFCIG